MAEMMKIKFKNRSKGDGTTEAAGKTFTLPVAEEKAYIGRGLAEEVAQTSEEKKAAEEAEKKAAAEAKAKADAEKKAAEDAAKK